MGTVGLDELFITENVTPGGIFRLEWPIGAPEGVSCVFSCEG